MSQYDHETIQKVTFGEPGGLQ